ncbi:MAG: DUF3418 domain-containing protein, partial [Betaproteobacteria bacterium]|nr:DUF3418 domain-containing protein [Betaproteobacteria bacterium]
QSRSLAELKAEFGTRAQTALQAAFQGLEVATRSAAPEAKDRAEASSSSLARPAIVSASAFDASERYKEWTIETLPELMELRHEGQLIIGFPALVDHGDAVGLQVFDDLDRAQAAHEAGVIRLLAIHFREPLRFFLNQTPARRSLRR